MNDSEYRFDKNIEDTARLLTELGYGTERRWLWAMIAAIITALLLIGTGTYMILSAK